jgi:hypothetical protein
MTAGGRKKNLLLFERVTVMGEGCGQWAGSAQKLVQIGGKMARKMLSDQNCRWKVGG